jgi:serine/threonine protein kinase
MAELVLSATGFALSAPGMALAFVSYARYLSDRFDAFKNAPENLRELREFFRDLYEGQLKTNIELAEWAFTVDDLDPALKASLENHLKTLRTELQEANQSLNELFHEDGSLRKRVKFLEFFGLTKARKVMESLRGWQEVFQGAIHLACMKKQMVPDDMLLTSSKFKPIEIGPDDGQYCVQLESKSHIWLGKAETLENSTGKNIREVSFVMERMEASQYQNFSDAKEIASYLARRLAANPSNRGILRCLGYRETNDHLELVFEVPNELEPQPQTLRSLLADDMDNDAGYGGGRPLDHRFRLAQQISEAILSVHTAQLVHKNIRPETILVFRAKLLTGSTTTTSAKDDLTGLGLPFLTDWKTVRKASDLSARKGGSDWTADIYRHPRRQGLQPEERYSMQHDIYSLGVCLLEIGLWEPFIITNAQGQEFMCDKFRELAVASGFVTQEESNSISKLTKPMTVQKVMIALAKGLLPQRMGLIFTDLVVYCLTCVEDDFSSSTNEATTVGIQFNDKILQSFPKMLL